MIGYIYKITNPSGNIYIGKTFNLKNRFNQYMNVNCESQPRLYNSIKKWGFNLHKVEIIFESENGVFYYGIKELSSYLNIPYKRFFNQIKYTDKYKNKYLVC